MLKLWIVILLPILRFYLYECTTFIMYPPCFHPAQYSFDFKRVKELNKKDFRLYYRDTIFNYYHTIPKFLYQNNIEYVKETNTLYDTACVSVEFEYISDKIFTMTFSCNKMPFKKVQLFRNTYGVFYNYLETEGRKLCNTDYHQTFKLPNVQIESDFNTFVTFAICQDVNYPYEYKMPLYSLSLLRRYNLIKGVENWMRKYTVANKLKSHKIEILCNECESRIFEESNCEKVPGTQLTASSIAQNGDVIGWLSQTKTHSKANKFPSMFEIEFPTDYPPALGDEVNWQPGSTEKPVIVIPGTYHLPDFVPTPFIGPASDNDETPFGIEVPHNTKAPPLHKKILIQGSISGYLYLYGPTVMVVLLFVISCLCFGGFSNMRYQVAPERRDPPANQRRDPPAYQLHDPLQRNPLRRDPLQRERPAVNPNENIRLEPLGAAQPAFEVNEFHEDQAVAEDQL